MMTDNPDWLSQRKAEWKEVKRVLETHFIDVRPKLYKGLKHYFITGEDKYDVLAETAEKVILNLWLHPDTSEVRWNEYWHELTHKEFKGNRRSRSYEQMQMQFFKLATDSYSMNEPYSDYGFCGGLEERIAYFFVRSPVFTHDTQLVLNYPCRLVPWRDENDLHVRFIGQTSKFLKYPGSNPYNPMQYLTELWLSSVHALEDLSYMEETFRRAAWYNTLAEADLDGTIRDQNRWSFSRKLFDALSSEKLPKQLDTYFRQAQDNPIAKGESI